MARLFGTDGVRGIANEKLSCELAFKLGQAGASVLLAASVFHFRMIEIPELKKYLRSKGVQVK